MIKSGNSIFDKIKSKTINNLDTKNDESTKLQHLHNKTNLEPEILETNNNKDSNIQNESLIKMGKEKIDYNIKDTTHIEDKKLITNSKNFPLINNSENPIFLTSGSRDFSVERTSELSTNYENQKLEKDLNANDENNISNQNLKTGDDNKSDFKINNSDSIIPMDQN